jgi:hypothetical protein
VSLESGARGRRGFFDPTDAGASAPSSEVGNRAVDEGDEAEGKGKQQGEHQRAGGKGSQGLHYRSVY